MIPIKVDKSVPCVERKSLSRVVGVLDFALDVVSASTRGNSLERSGENLGPEIITEEVAERYSAVANDDIAVGVPTALFVGELNGEEEGCIAGDRWSCENGGEESRSGCEDD